MNTIPLPTAAPGGLPTVTGGGGATPAAPGVQPSDDVMAAFSILLTRLAQDSAVGAEVRPAEVGAREPTGLDASTSPEDLWAAIWFPAPVSADPVQPPMQTAPRAVAVEGGVASWPRGESAAVATEALRSQEFQTPTAAPADTASSGPATFFVSDSATALAADEMTPTEILALVKTVTATAAATAETEAGPVEGVSQWGDPIAPGVGPLTSPDAAGRSSPVLREAGPSAQPEILDLRHPLAPVRLSESIVWQLDQGVHEVSIDLHPAELGKLEIRLKLEGERVDLRIDTVDPAVRDVVQTSLPNLASMLAARGLQLDQAQVFAQARMFTPGPGSGPTAANGTLPSESRSRTVSGPRVIRRGLIDDYV